MLIIGLIIAGCACVTAVLAFITATWREQGYSGESRQHGHWVTCPACQGGDDPDLLPPSGLCPECGISGGHWTS